MTQAQTILDINSKLSEVYAIVCANGLVKSVEKQQTEISEIKNYIADIKTVINRSDADRLEGCPLRKKMEEEAARISDKRRHKFDTRLVVYGLLIGVISAVPNIIMLFRG